MWCEGGKIVVECQTECQVKVPVPSTVTRFEAVEGVGYRVVVQTIDGLGFFCRVYLARSVLKQKHTPSQGYSDVLIRLIVPPPLVYWPNKRCAPCVC